MRDKSRYFFYSQNALKHLVINKCFNFVVSGKKSRNVITVLFLLNVKLKKTLRRQQKQNHHEIEKYVTLLRRSVTLVLVRKNVI